MKILHVTDVHNNYRAFKAVLDKHSDADEVWCTGDILLCGPSPSACLELVREHCTQVVFGNHDPEYARMMRDGLPQICCDRAEPVLSDIDYVLGFPQTAIAEADGRTYFLVHDAPPPLTCALEPITTDEVFEQALEYAGTDVILCGHSHIAMIHHVGERMVINAGSVGTPEDGDNRAQCMVIEDGVARFDRVEYDLEALARDYANSLMPKEHADYYLGCNRQGFNYSRGIRPGPFSAPCPEAEG